PHASDLRVTAAAAGDPFEALGDPNRRAIVELLGDGGRSVGELADALPISRPAVSRHLRLLKEAGLGGEGPVGTPPIHPPRPPGRPHSRRGGGGRGVPDAAAGGGGGAGAGFAPAAETRGGGRGGGGADERAAPAELPDRLLGRARLRGLAPPPRDVVAQGAL